VNLFEGLYPPHAILMNPDDKETGGKKVKFAHHLMLFFASNLSVIAYS